MNEQIILTPWQVHGLLMSLSLTLDCSDLDTLMELVLEKSVGHTINIVTEKGEI